jgi:predicted HTH domain antitoxin
MARKQPVVVMVRDQPEAVLFHLDDEGLLGEPGVRLALATALYKSESISIGRAARVAGMPLEAFMAELGRAGLPVLRGDAGTLRDDLKNIKSWRAR